MQGILGFLKTWGGKIIFILACVALPIILWLLGEFILVEYVLPGKFLEQAAPIKPEVQAPLFGSFRCDMQCAVPFRDESIPLICTFTPEQNQTPFMVKVSAEGIEKKVKLRADGKEVWGDVATIHFDAIGEQTRVVHVSNNRASGAWWFETQAIVVQLFTEDEKTELSKPQKISLSVETSAIVAMRDRQKVELSKNSPLYLLFAGLVSAISIVYKLLNTQLQDEPAGLLEQYKKDLTALHTKVAGITTAERSLKALKKKKIASKLSPGVLEWCEYLLEMAHGSKSGENKYDQAKVDKMLALDNTWADTVASILVYLASNTGIDKEKNVPKLSSSLRSFQAYTCSDKMRKAIREARTALGDTDPPQERKWPLFPKEFRTSHFLPNRMVDPFPALRAEEDHWLFHKYPAKQMYWPWNPLELIQYPSNQAYYLVGESGIGKTTLAYRLGRYHRNEPTVLGCYLGSVSGPAEIIFEQVKVLRAFVLNLPSFLSLLEPGEMPLLADLLSTYMDRKVFVSDLERKTSREALLQLWKDEDSVPRNTWISEIQNQVALLREKLEVSSSRLYLNQAQEVLVSLASKLGFTGLRVVMECNGVGGENDLEQVIGLTQQIWSMPLQAVLVFSEKGWEKHKHIDGLLRIEPHILRWDPECFQRMLEWRMERALTEKDRQLGRDYLKPEDLDRLIRRAECNPGSFAKIWREYWGHEASKDGR